MPFPLLIKLSCGLPFLIILIQVIHARIISSIHAVNVLPNLLTHNFHLQLLNIFRPCTDFVVGPTVHSIVSVHTINDVLFVLPMTLSTLVVSLVI